MVLTKGSNVLRVSRSRLWEASKFYRKEADRCFKARAYFFAIVARCCEIEALLRIFDFVQTRTPRARCKNLHDLINRAFLRHWIPHDALRHWKKTERVPLRAVLHEVREARNGVHAHLFDWGLPTRAAAVNVGFVADAMYLFLETKNARNLMKHLFERGKVSGAQYRGWLRGQAPLNW